MIKAKKSLGQNFLHDQNIINKIITIKEIEKKNILEVGPGTGNLTAKILEKKPKKFLVIEKDNELANILQKKFNNKIQIINNDILEIEENSLSDETLTVYGNLPYNISTEILAKWILNLDSKDFWFESLILMFQKEVADRIISRFDTSKYGRLSILTNWKLDVSKICDVRPNSFSPRPKVDSTLLFFKPKIKFYEFNNSKNLEEVTRVFFNQRRKKIKTPFNILFNINSSIIEKLKIDLNLRPHNLKPEIYYKLTKEYEKL